MARTPDRETAAQLQEELARRLEHLADTGECEHPGDSPAALLRAAAAMIRESVKMIDTYADAHEELKSLVTRGLRETN